MTTIVNNSTRKRTINTFSVSHFGTTLDTCFPLKTEQDVPSVFARELYQGILSIHKFFGRQSLKLAKDKFIRTLFVRRPNHKQIVSPLEFVFKDVPKEMALNHTHPTLASHRNNMDKTIQAYARANDRQLYDVGTASRNDNLGLPGSHGYYLEKDLLQEPRLDGIPSNALVRLLDVDYYLPSIKFYAGYDMVLGTLTPEYLSGTYGEAIYKTISATQIEMSVRGGGIYRHGTWNYEGELLSIDRFLWTYIYRVDKVKFTNEHSLVFLTLKVTVFNPFRAITKWLGIELSDLKRNMVVETPNYFYRKVYRDVGNEIVEQLQIQGKGQSTTLEMPLRVFVSLSNKVSTIKSGVITTSEVKSAWSNANGSDPGVPHYYYFLLQAILNSRELEGVCKLDQSRFVGGLANTLREKDKSFVEPVSYGETPNDDLEESVKVSAHETCPPLKENAQLSFKMNEAALDNAVQKRVIEVRNSVKFNKQQKQWRAEFVNLVVGKNTGIPQDRSDVVDQQTRPAQKSRNKRVQDNTIVNGSQSFFLKNDPTSMKNKNSEGLQGPSPARVISMFPASQCLDLAQFVYSFKELCKQQHWWGPGLDPEKLTEKVNEFSTNYPKEQIVSIDLSKMDGHINSDTRAIAQMCMLKYFKGYESVLKKIFKRDSNNISTNESTSLCYLTLNEQGSGSNLTTESNTLVSGFLDYARLRKEGKSPTTAFKMIGPKYGDDSLAYGASDSVITSYKDFGFEVTIDVVKRGQPIPYLSRLFVPNMGTMSSIVDTNRALGKVHLATNSVYSNNTNLYNRLQGYITTDGELPIFKEMLDLVKRTAAPAELKCVAELESFSVSGGAYPSELSGEEKATIMCDQLGITQEQLEDVQGKIKDAKTLDELLYVIPSAPEVLPHSDLPGAYGPLKALSRDRKQLSQQAKKLNTKTTTTIAVQTSILPLPPKSQLLPVSKRTNGRKPSNGNARKSKTKTKTKAAKATTNVPRQRNGVDAATTRDV